MYVLCSVETRAIRTNCVQFDRCEHLDVKVRVVQLARLGVAQGISFNEAIYSQMVEYAAVCDELEAAESFLNEMCSKEVPPHVRTFRPLQEAYARLGRCVAALSTRNGSETCAT